MPTNCKGLRRSPEERTHGFQLDNFFLVNYPTHSIKLDKGKTYQKNKKKLDNGKVKKYKIKRLELSSH